MRSDLRSQIRHSEQQARQLAKLATDALLAEARLTPKPGLVDQRGSGAHDDLNLALMERSAHSLGSTFNCLALQSWLRQPDVALRRDIGRIGREGERDMMTATGGVNTHRGAIWALGLLVSAAAMLGGKGDVSALTKQAAALASIDDPEQPRRFSNGSRVVQRFKVPGAREQAQLGFPHVCQYGLPQLRRSRAAGYAEEVAQLDALLAIMTALTDTCVLSRGGKRALNTMQRGSLQVLATGSSGTEAGRKALTELEQRLLRYNASPGGAADLLAATLFLDWLTSANPSTHD